MPELSGIFGPRVGALRGRRVLVSGGASGIGRATVALFIEQGARVAILDQDGPALEAACSKFGCIGREGSVADASLMVRLIDSIGEQLGGMDGLVHAVGIAPSDGFRAKIGRAHV